MLKIVKVLAGCGRNPIWVTCQTSSEFPGTMRIMVSHYDPPLEAGRYVLHVPCGKADVQTIADLYPFECSPDAQASRKALAKDIDPACVECEACPLRDLTLEEAFFPLVGDELAPNQPTAQSHWDA